MSEKRALITGLNGFTGFYLAEELKRAGFLIFGADVKPDESPDNHRVDLLDKAELNRVIRDLRPTVVVHLAAIAFVGHGNADAFYQVNVIGTRNLLAALAAEAPGLECVLLPSSANIYGNTAEGLLSEETPPNPANDYAVSKLAMEYMARLWMDRLPIVITRPFNYTGIGQAPQFLLPKIVGHFQRGEKVIELGNIDVERDFSDVRMVAEAYRRLLQEAPAGELFNVCSGTAWSLKEVLAMMAQIAGYQIEVRVNPAFVRANEVRRLQGDSRKLERCIGRLPPVALKETLAWMFEARD
jgi:nucleoside-diphosphate-sugar epimerase